MTIQANFPAIKPSLLLDFANTKQLDSRITYTRASTASFYNGVTTAMAEQNLILQSQTFDSASWGKSSATVTANTTVAPDGTTTADSIAITSSISVVYADLGANAAVGTYTFSCYVKAGTNNYVALNMQGNTTSWVTAIYDLSTGAVTQTANGSSGLATITTTSITSAGSGWYRCVLTFACTSSVLRYPCVMFAPSATGNTLTTNFGEPSGNTNGNTLIVWGAQLEQRSAVTAYTVTTTQAITNYIPALQSAASGVPRFDNNPTTGESLGLLIEESRTNLLTYSSQFDNTDWTKSNATVTTAANVSPDGTLNAQLITTGSVLGAITRAPTVSANSTNTFTGYFKYYSGLANTQIRLAYSGGTGVAGILRFNCQTGALVVSTVTSYSINSVGNNWFRVSATMTDTGSNTTLNVQLYTNAETTTANSLFLWGAQLEAGAFATSYIPTVASQVTRAADAASMTGTNFSTWFNNGEGTIYSESAPTGQTSNGHVLFSMLGTADNAIASGQYIASSAVRLMVVTVNNSNQVLIAGTNGTNNKIAGAYKINDFASSINGAAVSTDTSGTLPVVDKAYIGSFGANGQTYTGTIKKVSYYPIRLSNTNLVALTS